MPFYPILKHMKINQKKTTIRLNKVNNKTFLTNLKTLIHLCQIICNFKIPRISVFANKDVPHK